MILTSTNWSPRSCGFRRLGKATFTQAKLLSRFGAGRYLECGFALDRRDLDPCSESCLGDGDRNGHIDVVALASKERMLADVRDDEEVARLGSQPAALALSSEFGPASPCLHRPVFAP